MCRFPGLLAIGQDAVRRLTRAAGVRVHLARLELSPDAAAREGTWVVTYTLPPAGGDGGLGGAPGTTVVASALAAGGPPRRAGGAPRAAAAAAAPVCVRFDHWQDTAGEFSEAGVDAWLHGDARFRVDWEPLAAPVEPGRSGLARRAAAAGGAAAVAVGAAAVAVGGSAALPLRQVVLSAAGALAVALEVPWGAPGSRTLGTLHVALQLLFRADEAPAAARGGGVWALPVPAAQVLRLRALPVVLAPASPPSLSPSPPPPPRLPVALLRLLRLEGVALGPLVEAARGRSLPPSCDAGAVDAARCDARVAGDGGGVSGRPCPWAARGGGAGGTDESLGATALVLDEAVALSADRAGDTVEVCCSVLVRAATAGGRRGWYVHAGGRACGACAPVRQVQRRDGCRVRVCGDRGAGRRRRGRGVPAAARAAWRRPLWLRAGGGRRRGRCRGARGGGGGGKRARHGAGGGKRARRGAGGGRRSRRRVAGRARRQ